MEHMYQKFLPKTVGYPKFSFTPGYPQVTKPTYQYFVSRILAFGMQIMALRLAFPLSIRS